jgi:hypothetical protein
MMALQEQQSARASGWQPVCCGTLYEPTHKVLPQNCVGLGRRSCFFNGIFICLVPPDAFAAYALLQKGARAKENSAK